LPSGRSARARRATLSGGISIRRWLSLYVYKILFHCKAFLCESIIILLLPPHQLQSLPYCNTIARPLRNIRPPLPAPPLYAIHHTILAMAISCKGLRLTRGPCLARLLIIYNYDSLFYLSFPLTQNPGTLCYFNFIDYDDAVCYH